MPQSLFDWDDDEQKAGEQPPRPEYPAAVWEPKPDPDEYQALRFGQHPPAELQSQPVRYEGEPDVYQTQLVAYEPESPEEASRRGGLAWSAGIVFFSAVAFMLFLGWIADLLLGSSPWGIVAGILLGSVIGLVQFVRITSQIFNTKKAESAMHPLLPPDEAER